jgi:ribokinase
MTAGDSRALERARKAPVVVASPRARHALTDGETIIDALIFSARDADERAWAERVAAHAAILVETEGAAGGHWWGASEGCWTAAEPPAPVRDSYGCGDAFAAGFTFGLAGGASVEQAAALGASCGARCLTRDGAP